MRTININRNRIKSTLDFYNEEHLNCRRAEFMDRERMNNILDKMQNLTIDKELLTAINELKDYLKKTSFSATRIKIQSK